MKNILLSLAILSIFQGCVSIRKMNRLDALIKSQTAPIPEFIASTDTLLPSVNAAQTSESQIIATKNIVAKTAWPVSNRASVRQLRSVGKLYTSPRDSTELYARRKPVDLRVTNRTGLASFWLAMGSLGSFIISGVANDNYSGGSGTASGVFSLVGLLAGIAAFVTGLVSLSEFRRNPDKFKGKGYPIAGISWGGLLILVLVLGIILILALLSAW